MSASSLSLDELFFSLQGEAFQLGRPQLFLRLAGCPLRCSYCDTPRSWKPQPQFECHERDTTSNHANPIDAANLDAQIDAVLGSHGVARKGVSLAVTGGEPLEHADFLVDWLPSWEGTVMLETAGLYADRLERIAPLVDEISLDWKLPSTLRSGTEQLQSAACLRVAVASDARTWVKLVVTEETTGLRFESETDSNTDDEVGDALREIAALAPGIDVFLQPVTRFAAGPLPPATARLLEWTVRYAELDCALRVVPQIHPLLGVR